MVCYYNQYHSESTILWISPLENSKDSVDYASCLPLGKVGGLQILCCQGIAVAHYSLQP